jgi:hypothetical protein
MTVLRWKIRRIVGTPKGEVVELIPATDGQPARVQLRRPYVREPYQTIRIENPPPAKRADRGLSKKEENPDG